MRTPVKRVVETARLRLRPFSAADLTDWYRVVFSDPEVMRHLPAKGPVPIERTRALLHAFTEHWDAHGFGPWVVTSCEDGALLGHCGLRYLPDLMEVELIYALGRSSWGKGIATEAARASVRFGFEEVGLPRIVALAVAENAASRRVMEKVGMAYEKPAYLFGLDLLKYGVAREDHRPDGSPYELQGEPRPG